MFKLVSAADKHILTIYAPGARENKNEDERVNLQPEVHVTNSFTFPTLIQDFKEPKMQKFCTFSPKPLKYINHCYFSACQVGFSSTRPLTCVWTHYNSLWPSRVSIMLFNFGVNTQR